MSNIIKIISLFFFYFFGIKLKLENPMKEFNYKERKKNILLGNWYEKNILVDNDIDLISPMSGKIIKIHNNNSISLKNWLGLEIIILIQNENKNENFWILLKKKEKVKKGDCIAKIEIKEKNQQLKLSVIVPWQPFIIKKIEENHISYRNPFSKINIKNLCEY